MRHARSVFWVHHLVKIGRYIDIHIYIYTCQAFIEEFMFGGGGGGKRRHAPLGKFLRNRHSWMHSGVDFDS